jgi:hypothetical protein
MTRILTIAAVTLLAAAGSATAQTRATNPTNQPPGQMMQDRGSVRGQPGASGYTPGHEMQQRGSVRGTTGASGYAPGHDAPTTGTTTRR